jgi:hypothetical protein
LNVLFFSISVTRAELNLWPREKNKANRHWFFIRTYLLSFYWVNFNLKLITQGWSSLNINKADTTL